MLAQCWPAVYNDPALDQRLVFAGQPEATSFIIILSGGWPLHTANTRRSSDAGLMLVPRLRRCISIIPTLG